MDSLERYRALARSSDRASFVRHLGHPFLLKRPSRAAPPTAQATTPQRIAYETELIDAAELIDDQGAFSWQWRVLPVAKRVGNPFPERISVGRALNCDVVLRFAYVSKLHAHFVLRDRKDLELWDQRSANGTALNGRRLEPGESVPVSIGDTIRFGALELELVDAERLYDVVTTWS